MHQDPAQTGNNNNNLSLAEENEVLKIKMMLEHGALFGSIDEKLDAEMEHKFLKHIMEFEQQFSERKTLTVFEKLESPTCFLPISEISEADLMEAWVSLKIHMESHGVELNVCSPNISVGELYRFVTQELFKEEIDDINIPGMVCSFIYDDFYPDHIYDNTRTAVEDCVAIILQKHPVDFMPMFAQQGLTLNRQEDMLQAEFINCINKFYINFPGVDNLNIHVSSCDIAGNKCMVKGIYKGMSKSKLDPAAIEGTWSVIFLMNEKLGFWEIVNVQFSGLVF